MNKLKHTMSEISRWVKVFTYFAWGNLFLSISPPASYLSLKPHLFYTYYSLGTCDTAALTLKELLILRLAVMLRSILPTTHLRIRMMGTANDDIFTLGAISWRSHRFADRMTSRDLTYLKNDQSNPLFFLVSAWGLKVPQFMNCEEFKLLF